MVKSVKHVVTTERRSQLMASVKQVDTPLELEVRKILTEFGHRFRTTARDLPGSPDIVNRSRQWAIFVNGCYWHAHKRCRRSSIPKRNREFWKSKLARNRARDRSNVIELEKLGYKTLTVWQCEVENDRLARRKIRTFFNELERRPLVFNGQRFPRLSYSFSGRRDAINVNIRVNSKTTLRRKKRVSDSQNNNNPGAVHDATFLRQRSRPRSPTGDRSIKCVDLFSGCGGLSLGVQTACNSLGLSFESSLAMDFDRDAMDVFERNFQPSETEIGDICEYLRCNTGEATSDREASLIGQLPDVDMLVAGPPCQGHSDLNNHTRRDDARNNLYWRVVRFVELVRPTYFLIENVPTILHARQKIIPKAIATLDKFGYEIDSTIVCLNKLGVPQTRRRHILVGSLNGSIDADEVLDRFSVDTARTVSWAISDIENLSGRKIFDKASEASAENRRRMEYLFTNDEYDLPSKLRPKCHQKKHAYKSMYGRLRYDKPAQTITTGFGSPGQGRYIHPKFPRTITPHEAARLQYFPDFFDFSTAPTRRALATIIGNAVPLPLSYVIAMEFLAREL